MPKNDVTILPELQGLIAPLSSQERALLESQLKQHRGCLNPLTTWKRDDGTRVLLDGHNRHEICQRLGLDYQTRNISVRDIEHAKLWVLEHQAGRRNLTDDQRAIVWNDIREQRSRVTRAEQLAKARDAQAVSSVSDETEQPAQLKSKVDTRAAVATEAKLPVNKLKVAQRLKKHQPDLYKKVLAGDATLRDVSKVLKKEKKAEFNKDYFSRLGQGLARLYFPVDKRITGLTKIKKSEWTGEVKAGIEQLVLTLDEVDKRTEQHRKALNRVLREKR